MLWPFFTYFGGKWRSAKHYPGPLFDTIVEPFAGSAGYALRYPEGNVLLVDRDPFIIATWRYLMRATVREILALPDLLPGQSVDDLDLCFEAKLLIGWWCNKGTVAPCKVPGAWMRSGIRPQSFWGEAVRRRIAYQLDYISHWEILEGSYVDMPDMEATWFIDPPYFSAGRLYRYGSSSINYTELAEWCVSRRGQVIVCENEGADWLPFREFRITKASQAKYGGKTSKEVIWTNE